MSDKKSAVRVPQQQRSIEKKNKILEAARLVFNKKGYFGATTVDIANEAGLSTGSVYSYFTDKKDLLLACMNKFGLDLSKKMCSQIRSHTKDADITDTVVKTIGILVNSHDWDSRIYHDEIMSLKFRDEDVKTILEKIQKNVLTAVTAEAEAKGFTFRYPSEQTSLLFWMVDGLTDKLAFEPDSGMDKEIMVAECARLIVSMFDKKGEV